MPRLFRLISLIAPLTLGAQSPRRLTLGPATAKLNEEFSQVINALELTDGRVLVTDFREQRLAAVDFSTNTVKTIGRRGDGPGEYALVGSLFPFGKDSTVMVLGLAQRWNVITSNLELSTLPPDSPLVRIMGRHSASGIDDFGHVLFHGEPRHGPGIERDTSALILLSRRTMKGDTIARTDGGAGPGRQQSGRAQDHLYGDYDQALLGRDGWIAIVRHSPYRVEWRSPEGRWRIGPIADVPTPLTDAEKTAYLDRRAKARAAASPSTKIITAPGLGVKQKQGGTPIPEPELAFPKAIPPFNSFASPLYSLQGYLLVLRNATKAEPGRLYDVFDRQGSRVAQLAFPSNQRPVAFGAKSIYVVTTDDNGIERLSRHAWPIR
jgi:hypothetical protein